MKRIFYIMILSSTVSVFSMVEKEIIVKGTVSYISSQNIFVKFENTDGIEIGDTLFIKERNNFIPAIVVDHKASTSCAGYSITNKKIEVNTFLFAFTPGTTIEDKQEALDSSSFVSEIVPFDSPTVIITKRTLIPVPTLSGKISVQSYSNFSNNSNIFDYQRWRYTFQLSAERIGNSKFSYYNYISFAYRADDWDRVSSDLFEALRIYDLAIKYNFNDRTFIWLGRHLNNKISSISSIDGLQFETGINQWSFGLAVGTRPDFNNMEFNSKLFEYGAYVNRADILGFGDMQNTLGYFEQTNDFKTDRRFLYFQHSNSAIKYTRLFVSTEVDIYKKELGESKTEPTLTSIYGSMSIRPSNYFSIMLSYDARKNVIYYETFKTILDSIIENETRQGFRSRLTIKPVRNLFLGADYGYRFRPGDLKPSNNYGGYITYSQIPKIETNATVSFSRLSSSFVEGDVWNGSLSRPIINGIDIMLGYRFTNYKFRTGINELKQHSGSINLNTFLLKPILLNFTYEGIFEDVHTSGRFLANITYRF